MASSRPYLAIGMAVVLEQGHGGSGAERHEGIINHGLSPRERGVSTRNGRVGGLASRSGRHRFPKYGTMPGSINLSQLFCLVRHGGYLHHVAGDIKH